GQVAVPPGRQHERAVGRPGTTEHFSFVLLARGAVHQAQRRHGSLRLGASGCRATDGGSGRGSCCKSIAYIFPRRRFLGDVEASRAGKRAAVGVAVSAKEVRPIEGPAPGAVRWRRVRRQGGIGEEESLRSRTNPGTLLYRS